MERKKILFPLILALTVTLSLRAQDANDSIPPAVDSTVIKLQIQIQEMELQRIMMEAELERMGRDAQLDSLAKAQRRQRIDSLRHVTPGAPVVVDGDTLFYIFASRGGQMPEIRAKEARERIEELGHRLTFSVDSLVVFDSDAVSDVMAGEQVIFSLTDLDALWQDTIRTDLAHDYARITQAKVQEMQHEFGLKRKLLRTGLALLLVVIQLLLIRCTNWLFHRYQMRILHHFNARLRSITLKDYEFLNIHQQTVIMSRLYTGARYLTIFAQLLVSVPLLFSIFPETKTLTYTILGYIWHPVRDIFVAVLSYLPNLIYIIVIWLCFRYLVRGIRYFANEIQAERLKITGFYPDWAMTTFFILRVLLYALMIVMIWPLLPNSDSAIFQGISVFVGLIISIGSSSIIGNIMSGLVMTYMRPFKVGDYIQVGETVGEVIEKNILVTRIRTRKNEVVTIQNSVLLGSQTSNYTVAANTYGLIVHTKVTIGYDVPWQQVRDIMESAAAATPGVLESPKPFMMVTALDDFYVEYEINAYTSDAEHLSRVYSELHQNLLRRFFEEGVEIMSPHIIARRDGLDLQMPPSYTET